MAADKFRQCLGAAGAKGDVADVKSLDGLAVFVGGAFAFDDSQGAGAGKVGLGRFEGVDFYGSFVEASVAAIGFLGVDKKGVVSAFCSARWEEWRFGSLSWRT